MMLCSYVTVKCNFWRVFTSTVVDRTDDGFFEFFSGSLALVDPLNLCNVFREVIEPVPDFVDEFTKNFFDSVDFCDEIICLDSKSL